MGSADAIPGGNAPGKKSKARSAASLSGMTSVISIVPRSTVRRSSGHAIDGSPIASFGAAIWTRNRKPIGLRDMRSRISRDR